MALPCFGDDDGLFPGRGRARPDRRHGSATRRSLLAGRPLRRAADRRDPRRAAAGANRRPRRQLRPRPALRRAGAGRCGRGPTCCVNPDSRRPRRRRGAAREPRDPADPCPARARPPGHRRPARPHRLPRRLARQPEPWRPSRDRTTTTRSAREMVATCRAMNASGINQGTAGNISVRNAKGFLITPSSLPYDTMAPADIVQMYFDGSLRGRAPAVLGMALPPRHPAVAPGRRLRRPLPFGLRDDARRPPQADPELPLHDRDLRRHRPSAAPATPPSAPRRCRDAALEALEGRTACLLGQHGQIAARQDAWPRASPTPSRSRPWRGSTSRR